MIASMWAARGMIARFSLGVLVGCGGNEGEPQEPDAEPELIVFDEGEAEPRLVARDAGSLHGPLFDRYPAATPDDPFVFERHEGDRLTIWAVALAQ
jgi:hypothetical protein